MEQQQPQQRKGPLSLDLDTLIDNTPAAEIVVNPPSAKVSDEETLTFIYGLSDLTDYKLEEDIKRKKRLLETTGEYLPNKGAKLRHTIKCFEHELHRRKLNHLPQIVDEDQATTIRSSYVGYNAKPNNKRVAVEVIDEPASTNPQNNASDNMHPMSIPAQIADLRTHIDEQFRKLRQHVDTRFRHMELKLLALEIALQLISKS